MTLAVKTPKTRTRSNTKCHMPRRGSLPITMTHPEIAAEWDTEANERDISTVSRGVGDKVWWVCSIHPTHKWKASVKDRTVGKGCPFCSGRRVKTGITDLATLAPAVAVEWHPTKNGELNPTDVTYGTDKIVWWVCSTHPAHEWERCVSARTSGSGSGCSVCAGRQVEVGFNDLASQRPEIAAEWHPTKNGELNPTDVTYGTDKIVWWVCSTHPAHEWERCVSARTSGRGCPTCSGSRIERMVFEGIRRMGINARPQYKITDTDYDRLSIKVDILLPESKTVIEYDGVHWHSLSHNDGETARRDHLKTLALLAQGYKVIRIRDFMASGERLHLLDIDSDALIQLTYQHSLKQEDVDALVARIIEAVNTLDKKSN